MTDLPDFDLATAHKYFSTHCFNQAWDLIDKPNRTPEENEEMIRLSLASTWHWTQRSDCKPQNLSVGYWQTSRIYAILGDAVSARRYGQLSLDSIQKQSDLPFYVGYAYEALARAESLAGSSEKVKEFQAMARENALKIQDANDRETLLKDLDSI